MLRQLLLLVTRTPTHVLALIWRRWLQLRRRSRSLAGGKEADPSEDEGVENDQGDVHESDPEVWKAGNDAPTKESEPVPKSRKATTPAAKAKGKAKSKAKLPQKSAGDGPIGKAASSEGASDKGSKKKTKAQVEDQTRSENAPSTKRKAKEVEEVVEEQAADQDALERKKRQSRKSSAYHRAKAVALKEGKSEEEAKALGKKAV